MNDSEVDNNEFVMDTEKSLFSEVLIIKKIIKISIKRKKIKKIENHKIFKNNKNHKKFTKKIFVVYHQNSKNDLQ